MKSIARFLGLNDAADEEILPDVKQDRTSPSHEATSAYLVCTGIPLHVDVINSCDSSEEARAYVYV
jgi:hypothetical protein